MSAHQVSDAPIFAKGDRVRDPSTGRTGEHGGVVPVHSPRGMRVMVAVLWDDGPAYASPHDGPLELT